MYSIAKFASWNNLTLMQSTTPRSRALALALMVLSAFFAVVTVLAIIGVWIISSALTNSLTRLLSRAEVAATRVEQSLQQVDDRFSAAQARIQTIEQRVAQAGATVEEANLLRLALDKLIGDELAPILNDARATVEGIVLVIEGIEDAIAAVNSIPFVNVEVPGAQTYRELRDQVTSLVTAMQELRTTLQNKKVETVQELVTTVTGFTTRANDIVARLRAPITTAQTQTAALRARLAQAKAELPGRIALVAFLLTLALVWFLISQALVFAVGWSLRKGTPVFGFRMVSA